MAATRPRMLDRNGSQRGKLEMTQTDVSITQPPVLDTTTSVESVGGPKKREFFGALESLRGIAALLVVLYHFPPWFWPAYDVQLVRHSYVMVNFFFVLSGFVLFHSYGRRITSGASFLKFAVSRLGRLYPVHIIFMAPFVLIELGKYVSFLRHGASGFASAPSLARLGHSVLLNVFLVQGFRVSAYEPSLNFPSWSISTEFYTYLLFGVAIMLFSKRGFSAVCWFLVMTSVLLLLALGPVMGDLANALRCVAGFFLGCLTRRALDSLRGLKASFDLPVVLAVASLLGIAVHWNNGVRWQELVSLPVSSLLILSLLLMPSSALNTVLVSKPLRRLGEVSYSLYMSHALVLWGARQVVHVVLKKPDPVVGASQLSAAAAAIAYPALIAVTLLVAVVSYHTLEAPLRDAARRRLSA